MNEPTLVHLKFKYYLYNDVVGETALRDVILSTNEIIFDIDIAPMPFVDYAILEFKYDNECDHVVKAPIKWALGSVVCFSLENANDTLIASFSSLIQLTFLLAETVAHHSQIQ